MAHLSKQVFNSCIKQSAVRPSLKIVRSNNEFRSVYHHSLEIRCFGTFIKGRVIKSYSRVAESCLTCGTAELRGSGIAAENFRRFDFMNLKFQV